jgi:voltage-gated potassium channel
MGVTRVWQVPKDSMFGSFLRHFVELLAFGAESASSETVRMGRETMSFAHQAGAAVFLVTLTLSMQCAGVAVLIGWARTIEHGLARLSSLHAAILMIRFSTLVIVLHFLQIFVWSVFYRWYCLPSWESSFYFSATSYSTVGYGDVVLPGVYRLLGPVESVTGVLMCGISVSGLVALATKLVGRESSASPMEDVRGLNGRAEAELENISRSSEAQLGNRLL